MILQLSDKLTLTAALDKVERGEYFDALCLFARVDGYESMLNQIGCLCKLGDISYALELYHRLLARFFYTHNCYFDVTELGEAVKPMLTYFNDETKGETAKYDFNKLCADSEFLANYGVDDDMYGYDEVEDLLETLSDTVDELENPSQFVDVKSLDFARQLCYRLGKAFASNQATLANKLKNQFLDLQSNEPYVLEMQLFFCHVEENTQLGQQFALRLAECETPSARSLSMAIMFLADDTESYAQPLKKLLWKLVDVSDEITDTEVMVKFIHIAASLGYDELTLTLTYAMYFRHNEFGCTGLKVCSKMFVNCHNPDLAREAALKLVQAVPWDSYAQQILSYINQGYGIKLDGSVVSNSMFIHFDSPSPLTVLAQYALLNSQEQGLLADSQSYVNLDYVYRACSDLLLKSEVEKYFETATVLSGFVKSLQPLNTQEFADFAKVRLSALFANVTTSKELLNKLIDVGYRDKVLITYANGAYYTLNLKDLTETSPLFISALSMAASMRKVDVKRMERAFRKLRDTLKLEDEFVDVFERQVAYAMLVMSYKNFEQSITSDYFGEEDTQLYLQYIQQTTDN